VKRSAIPVPTEYLPLHKYLDNRFADTVVLTFNEIEDLLGARLPELASRQNDWWANEGTDSAASPQSLSWTQASRTAEPNLRARSVRFERVSA
jgi:hypothetical protein